MIAHGRIFKKIKKNKSWKCISSGTCSRADVLEGGPSAGTKGSEAAALTERGVRLPGLVSDFYFAG